MAKRITLRQYESIAEDHNKHNTGDNWSWEDVIFNECLCGHNIKDDFDRMSKKETLMVMDWAIECRLEFRAANSSYCQTYVKIYKAALSSLEQRL